jgi:hypothetical protein
MDWIAATLNIVGMWLLPKRRYWAMIVFIASCTTFIVWGITQAQWAIVALQVVLLILNIRTIYIWRKHEVL